MRLFLDTSVLVESLISAAAAGHLTARCAGHARVVSSQVLGETYSALTKKRGRPAPLMDFKGAAVLVRAVAQSHEVVPVFAEDVLEGLRMRLEHQAQYWDAVVAATSRRARCDRFETLDSFGEGMRRELAFESPFPEGYVPVATADS